MTRYEFALLIMLAAEPERTFTRELIREIWGCEIHRSRTLDSHAHRLRKKLTDTAQQLGAEHERECPVFCVGIDRKEIDVEHNHDQVGPAF